VIADAVDFADPGVVVCNSIVAPQAAGQKYPERSAHRFDVSIVTGVPLETMRALVSLRLAVFPDTPPPATFGKGSLMMART
jgi:hypothetical protein